MLGLPPAAELFAILTGWLAAAFGWIKWLYELREKRQEKAAKEQAEAAKEKAEAALQEIRRRSTENSPLFLISKRRFNGLIVGTPDPGQFSFYSAGSPALLCFYRDEVETTLASGEPIYLAVDHCGVDAYEIRVSLDGEPAALVDAEADKRQIYALKYNYDPKKHGKEQVFELSFLAASGVRDVHKYLTLHGVRTLRRVDPA